MKNLMIKILKKFQLRVNEEDLFNIIEEDDKINENN